MPGSAEKGVRRLRGKEGTSLFRNLAAAKTRPPDQGMNAENHEKNLPPGHGISAGKAKEGARGFHRIEPFPRDPDW
ncbi:MAG: hypothetical protein C6P37_07245 [Caldibacillus debilis]|uniref:Uncharacterized protein n=1 Tax=Caldibacillus debilis TaxID=301148 RepID=A0A150M726_9BACI|nr:hypothetical protein B4135_0808 [Caldibacillus debilis]MBO2481199.1 hypothetical protein [Bacillaceae bacterium]REJ15486.1 MAG: hypothetical protein C6W57_11425 [Caldibacillus debilis]REJ29027.1 MAG: hypothetical protein C6P37_07245 [Caldibacillus debilis]REJ30951.1 MAG: hypothetical protein C6W56_01100 [Caldibacillus debilis]